MLVSIILHVYTWNQIRSERKQPKQLRLGFGCSASHSGKGKEGVRIPAGCSSAKGPTKTWAPGVGRRRRRSPSRRHERERERTTGERAVWLRTPRNLPHPDVYINNIICRVGCQFVTGPQVYFWDNTDNTNEQSFRLLGWLVRIVAGSWRSITGWFVW